MSETTQKEAVQKSNDDYIKENEQLKSQLNSIKEKQDAAFGRKVWFGERIVTFFMGSGLKSSMAKLYSELPHKMTKETLADVTTHIIWRFTRIGLFAIFFAAIPTILLYQQNNKIEKQNDLFSHQNNKIDIQTELLEADRRSALIFLLGNLMDNINNELKEDWNEDGIRNFSPQLIGGIISLSTAFKPYKYLSTNRSNNKLIRNRLSPERGQLLTLLVNSEIDTTTLKKIYESADFSYSDLPRANFQGAYLEGINLKKSSLFKTNLRYANLRRVNFENAYLDIVNFYGANLQGANFYRSNLNSTYVKISLITGLDTLPENYSGRTNFIKANLEGANFVGVGLGGVMVKDIDSSGAILNEDDLLKQYFKDNK